MEGNTEDEYIHDEDSEEDLSHCQYCYESEEVEEEEPYDGMISSKCYESVVDEEEEESENVIHEDDSKLLWPEDDDQIKPWEDCIPGQFEDAPETAKMKDQEQQEELAENQDVLDISYHSSILLLSIDDNGFFDVMVSEENNYNIFLLEPGDEATVDMRKMMQK